jgi:hypothetical protein
VDHGAVVDESQVGDPRRDLTVFAPDRVEFGLEILGRIRGGVYRSWTSPLCVVSRVFVVSASILPRLLPV